VTAGAAGGAAGGAGSAGGSAGAAVGSAAHDHIRAVLAARGACFFRELGGPGLRDTEILEALWDLVWAGEVTGDAFSAVRATIGSSPGGTRRPARSSSRPGAGRPRPRLGALSAVGPPRGAGRWSLVERELGGVTPAPTEAGIAVAGLLLERHGVLTREAVRGEGLPGGFAGVYPVLRTMEESGRIRRGYFVAGMGGAQFALPGAVDRLRALREPGSPPAPDDASGDWSGDWSGERSGSGRGGAAVPDRVVSLPAARLAGGGPGTDGSVLVLAATDPANAFGLGLPWPVRGPSRVPGAYVVLVDGVLSLYVERGGKGLVGQREYDGTWEARAVGALGHLVAAGTWGRLALQHWPEELDEALREASFTPTPKGLIRYSGSA
jgi:ATP-dependent Lhr-like helicase